MSWQCNTQICRGNVILKIDVGHVSVIHNIEVGRAQNYIDLGHFSIIHNINVGRAKTIVI